MSGTIPGYPWKEGDPLFASALNGAFLPLSGGVVNGETVFKTIIRVDHINTDSEGFVALDAPVLFAFNGDISTGQRALSQGITFTGTAPDAGRIIPNFFAAQDHVTSSGGLNYFEINHSLGGPTLTGPRRSLAITTDITAASGNPPGAGSPDVVSAVFTTSGHVNNGGTALDDAHVSGAMFSFNTVADLGPAATFYGAIVGYELDVRAQAGSSLLHKLGLSIVMVDGDMVSGSKSNIGILLGNQYKQGAGVGWDIGLSFGSVNIGAFPVKATGTLIGGSTFVDPGATALAAYGIDFSAVTFSAAFLKSQGFIVDGNGRMTVHLDNAANDAGAAAAGTGLNQLYRNGNAVQVRLA